MTRQFAWIMTAMLTLTAPLAAGPLPLKKKFDAAAALSTLTGHSPEALAGSLRGFLVDNLQPLLYESWPGWGKTVPVKRTEWHGQGLNVRPEVRIKQRKDGTWQHIRFTADNLADTLIVDIRDLKAEPGRITFQVFLAFDANIYHLVQKWKKGLKLYDGHTQARLRVKVLLACEASCRLESSGSLLPDAVVRFRVARSDVGYDNLVFEHVGGLGGEAAQLLGDAIHNGIEKLHPDLEANLLGKANAAIVKAADTKEVRVSLLKLLKKD